jgi:hypothetical protein
MGNAPSSLHELSQGQLRWLCRAVTLCGKLSPTGDRFIRGGSAELEYHLPVVALDSDAVRYKLDFDASGLNGPLVT